MQTYIAIAIWTSLIALSSGQTPGNLAGDLIPVTNSYNCGTQATYFFLSAAGINEDFAQVRSEFGEKSRITTFRQILNVLQSYKIDAVGVSCSVEDLKSVPYALVALKEPKTVGIAHFALVIFKKNSDGFLVADLNVAPHLFLINAKQLGAIFENKAILPL